MASNNSDIVKMARPMLSSIAPPIYDIGAVAMRILTKLIENQEVPQSMNLPYTIQTAGTN